MKKRYIVTAALLAALVMTAVIGTGVLNRLDRQAQDALFQQPRSPSTDIVIIGIDEDALAELGPYPWPRDVIGDALFELASDPQNMPAVVAVDILYAGASSDPTADAYLANAAGLLPRFVTACMAEFGDSVVWEDGRAVSASTGVTDFIQPFDALREKAVQGHINAMLDQDGILRHALLYVDAGPEQRVYSMAWETARLFAESRGKTLRLPPVNAGGHYYVPFTARPESYYDGASVAALLRGDIPSAYWANKIVLIGPYAPALNDFYFTSMDKALPMYGVEYQANVIQSLLEENHKRDMADLPQLAVLFMLCFAAGILFLSLKVGPGGGVCAGLMLMSMIAAFGLYLLGFVVHLLWPMAAVLVIYVLSVICHYILAARERQALALENERISAELSLATRIQTSVLPKDFPDRPEFEIHASMTPAKEVGGDLYDFFLADDSHLCLVIGDVSGKGVPAALFMMLSDTLIHYVAQHEFSPAKILQSVNQEICQRNPEEMFVTVWLGMLDLSTGKLTAANAGHEYPALKTGFEPFSLYKDRHGLVIGGMDMARYREYEIQLTPGDKLFVYTDGIPEAANIKNEFYGTDRMTDALRSVQDKSPAEILSAVTRSVQAFTGTAPQFDDQTMICLTWHGHRSSAERPDLFDKMDSI